MVGAFVALPFQAVQLMLALTYVPIGAPPLPALGLANLVLLIGVCTPASDFPIAGRGGRAALIGIGIPMLLPGPTVLDAAVRVVDPSDLMIGIPFLVLNLLLLLMLGCAEAGIYLLATRPKPQY